MIGFGRDGEAARRSDAARWVVRLEAGDLPDHEAVAFDAWVSAPANAAAFDAALSVSQAYSGSATAVARGLAGQRRPAAVAPRRAVLAAGGLAAAAAAAAIIAPELLSGPAVTRYATDKGERRTVRLDDGTTLDLNAGTRLTVTYTRRARDVDLQAGQAVFDVAHDARRPFRIAAGDRIVRVVGTQFDIRRRDGRLSVTVARGAVEVLPTDGAKGRAYRLHPGQRLDHAEGASGAHVASADPQEVFGWRTGRLVYRGQPLSEVVADLNQQFATPIRIDDPQLAATPISGVLVLDDQAAVIRRLALLVPVRAVPSGPGVVLRRDVAPDR